MTAYRMARTLEAAEFLVRERPRTSTTSGPAAIAMAYVAEDNSEFVEHGAHPRAAVHVVYEHQNSTDARVK